MTAEYKDYEGAVQNGLVKSPSERKAEAEAAAAEAEAAAEAFNALSAIGAKE